MADMTEPTTPEGTPKVTRSWLRFDDVECVRGGHHWAGPEGDLCYVVDGEGMVCPEHITDAERQRAVPQT